MIGSARERKSLFESPFMNVGDDHVADIQRGELIVYLSDKFVMHGWTWRIVMSRAGVGYMMARCVEELP